MNYQHNAQNLEIVKKVGYTVGGSILGSVIITFVLIVGAIIGVFFLV
jgi:hypothetical protein